jgi:tetratricopeptide (TPR) repeat protein
MSLPPAAVLPLLTSRPDERLLGTLLTSGVHRFPSARLGQSGPTAAIWAVATHRRFWLVAHDPAEERTWAVAAGDPEQVRVGEGWQRDVLVVGAHAVPLRRGTRAEARALRRRFAAGSPAGEPWPLSCPLPPDGPPIAEGAELPARPPWVPAIGPDERVLCAFETDHRVPTEGFAGPDESPLHLWVSTHRVAVVAADPDGGPAIVRELPPGPPHLDGRTLAIDDARLLPRGTREQAQLALALMVVADPTDRWAIAARHALIQRQPERALRLLSEATRTGHGDACWPHIGEIALAAGQGPLAVAAAARALVTRPELDVPKVIALWEHEATAVARTLRAARISWRLIREHLGGALDDLATTPAPPEALPGPATRPAEAWASALAALGRHAEARAVWPPPLNARDQRAHAALAERAGDPDAAQVWQRAAERAREESLDPYFALAQATGLDETAARRWRWAAWAWADGRHAEARASWRRAIALDDGAGALVDPMPPDARRALAAVAEGAGRHRAATRALRAAIEQDRGHEPTRLALARLLAGPLKEPLAAAEQRLALVVDLDAGRVREPAVARHDHLVEAAALLARAGDPDRALAALHEAVAGSFLDERAWRDALACEAVFVPAPVRAWWEHILGVLVGAPVGPPPAPAPTLSASELDALHPGGARWLTALRQTLDHPPAPDALTLTRGLDRLAEAGRADIEREIDALAERLGLPASPPAYAFRGASAFGVSAWPGKSPVLLIGFDHLRPDRARHLGDAELRFALAAELVHLRCEHPLLSFEQTWLRTSRSAYDHVDAWAGTAEVIFDLATLLPGLDQARKVGTLVKLGRVAFAARGNVNRALKLSDPLATWFGGERPAEPRGLSRERLTDAALRLRMQAERAALLLTGDLGAAIRATLKLSTQAAPLTERLTRDGLLAALRDDGPLSPSEALRITSLLAFAAAHRPVPERVAPLAATR